jgi:hypothetical protein
MMASVLDDFIDQEVLDLSGATVGTLSCYWEGHGGMIFLGVKMKGREDVRVVPGLNARADERLSCVRVNFRASQIRNAPEFDCDKELKASLEHAASEHFGIEDHHAH